MSTWILFLAAIYIRSRIITTKEKCIHIKIAITFIILYLLIQKKRSWLRGWKNNLVKIRPTINGRRIVLLCFRNINKSQKDDIRQDVVVVFLFHCIFTSRPSNPSGFCLAKASVPSHSCDFFSPHVSLNAFDVSFPCMG